MGVLHGGLRLAGAPGAGVVLAEGLGDVLLDGDLRLLGDARRVGAHVGDEALMPLVA